MSIFYDYPGKLSELNALTEKVIGAAIQVHKALGPGLLESAYEACMLFELRKSWIHVESQVVMPIFYDGHIIDAGYRIDMLIEHRLVVELKAIERLLPVHQAQIMSYMKLGGKGIGLLINFNVPIIKEGIKRIILDPGNWRNAVSNKPVSDVGRCIHTDGRENSGRYSDGK